MLQIVLEGFKVLQEVLGGCCCIIASALGFTGMLVGVGGFWGTTIGEA